MFTNLAQRFKKKNPVTSLSEPFANSWSMPARPEGAVDPLFSGPRVVPQVKPAFDQPRNDLAGFFSGLREAAERFAMTHIEPLAALNPVVRFRLRTVAVYVRPENDKLLHELQALQAHIIKTAAVNCLKQSRVADRLDLSEFFGIIIVAGEEVAAGEAVMTLATVGIERINIEFEFEGEHVVGDEPVPDDVSVAPAPAFSLRLVHPDGRVESLTVPAFPALIGKSSEAGIRVSGTFVSREHATLYFDPVLRRVVLQDHSRHGTWLNGKRLDATVRGILVGSGQIRLAAADASDAPSLEYSLGTVDAATPTPLMPALEPKTVRLDVEPKPIEKTMPVPSSPALVGDLPALVEGISKDLPRGGGHANETALSQPGRRDVVRPASAQETQLSSSGGPHALAWLQVRTIEGESVVPITELPFIIGRDPKGAGFSLTNTAEYVSREHLRLVSYHHKCFTIENGGLGRNNTYRKGVLLDNRFLYQPVPATGDSGWLVLGGNHLDERSVEIRLLVSPPGVQG